MKIIIKEMFKDDYITRQAGEKLRLLILDAIRKEEKLTLDFSNLKVASVSFFDESIAKLADEKIKVEDFVRFIAFEGLNVNDQKVLDKVSSYRGFELGQKKSI